ncbi:hypothetical protein FRACYDRAFT_259450 [Fragilariopsis cylindrus CCMP1102]|uniref:BZIP domain-containing protein n=1 Tax=Fragilariopsis cylindrus CCMP1102 TaxID=635003 RepID=A0A1E7FZW8_9STRA|nr:hypothetical protein FRACYDRAFT_259450 [Fragilariopsis cylindrus CCMP1102]|eukprot:OEU23690.1 hypothetical protein FRACYDRAFT_259450 [Fragilariopsis cylindrus CCMP1102]
MEQQNNESLQNQQQPMAIAMGAVSNDIPASSKVKDEVTPATTIAAVAVAPSLTTSMSIDTASSSDPSYILNGSTTTTTTTPTSGGAANNKNKRKRPIPSPTTSLQDATSTDTLGDNDNNEDDPEQEQDQSLLSRIGKDGEPLSDKKLRRLEKNRLSARECRRRKREATESMQRQINILEGENLRLRLQLQVGEEAEQSSHQKQIDTTKALDELLKSGKASESEIYAKIEEYKEQFADYGRDRRSAMEFHLRNVERLLMPTQTTSFIMNTLKGTHNNTGTSTSIDSSSSSSSSSKAKNTTGTTSTTTPTPTNNTTTTPGGNTTPTNSSGNEIKAKNEDNTDGGGGGGSDQNQSMTSIPTQNITTSSVAAATAIMTSPTKYDSNDTHHPEPQHTTPSSETSPPPPPATTSTATTSSVFATPSSYTPPKNSKELFTHIVKILEVTPEQAGALKDSRFVAQEMDVTLKETLICLKELRGRLEQCGQDLDTEFNCIRQILTPSQSAKFLVWVAQNKACMHMLNELWSKNYIDHTTDSLSSPTTTAMEIAAAETATAAETSMSISSKTLLSSSSSEE